LLPAVQTEGFDGLWDRDTEELKRLLNTPGIEIHLAPLPQGGTFQDLARYVVRDGSSTRVTKERPSSQKTDATGRIPKNDEPLEP
jgi:hypothetical protein